MKPTHILLSVVICKLTFVTLISGQDFSVIETATRGCEVRDTDDFVATPRNNTFTQPPNSTTFSSWDDTIRVELYLPAQQLVRLQSLLLVPNNVDILTISFSSPDNTEILRSDKPDDDAQLEVDVTNMEVNKLTVIAYRNQSSNNPFSFSIHHLGGCLLSSSGSMEFTKELPDSDRTPATLRDASSAAGTTKETTATTHKASTRTSTASQSASTSRTTTSARLPYTVSAVENTTASQVPDEKNTSTLSVTNSELPASGTSTATSKSTAPDLRQVMSASNTSVSGIGGPAGSSAGHQATTARGKGGVTTETMTSAAKGVMIRRGDVRLETTEALTSGKRSTEGDDDLQVQILAGSIAAAVEVLLTALLLFWQRNKLCSRQGRRRHTKVSTIVQV